MPTMITWFVHSTSEDNEAGVRGGWQDSPLSQTGLQQSESLRELLSDRRFDRVYSSDLRRTVQTAAIAFPSHEVMLDPRLREMNYGELNGHRHEDFPADESWCIHNRFPDGESCLDVQRRMEAFLEDCCAADMNIAIVSHRFPQLALEVLLNGRSWEEAIGQDWRTAGEWQPVGLRKSVTTSEEDRMKPPRVLITGMSATGKTSVIEMLRKRGYRAVDMDDPGHSYRNDAGHQLWRESVVEEAFRDAGASPLFVSGCAENQVKFYPEFTAVILLSAPRDVILDRLSNRTNNPYGKTAAEREEVLQNLEDIEPLLRHGASCEIVTTMPADEIVERVLECAGLT